MAATRSRKVSWIFCIGFLCAICLVDTSNFLKPSKAQSAKIILVSQDTSTRAIALDSVTQKREPFDSTSAVQWGNNNRTRVMLFAMGFDAATPASAVMAEAEDGFHNIYAPTIEYVGPTPGQEWATSVIIRLNEQMGDLGDVLIGIRYNGVKSNRVRVGIGHVGDGPPDDPGAVPTPGSIAPRVSPNATAGTLTTSDVQTIIAQAVSAAAALNRAVTVAVTDREGNVLGVFQMTGAPATTRITGGGRTGQGLEGLDVPASLAAISKAGTASVFSTQGNAFTSRTASFIIQEHFPPGVSFQPGGPLFGVQFSQLPCSDIKRPALPLGLSADAGSAPLYKHGV